MKAKSFVSYASLGAGLLFAVTGCGSKGGDTPTPGGKFSYTVKLESGRTNQLYKGEEDRIIITETNPDPTVERDYTYQIGGLGADYLDVSKDTTNLSFTLTPKQVTGAGKVTVTIKEAVSKINRTLSFSIDDKLELQEAGKNYASDTAARAEILGKLEEYAMSEYLTGITLFENGGYVRYANRVNVPASEYITGYGWGILSEGSLTGNLPNPLDSAHPTYYQSSSSSDPITINAWDATGSQVSDLNGYITSSYWGTRMKGTDSYEWYPVLAKDTVNGKPNLRPISLEEPNELNMYRKWRIYVKTGAEDGIKYRTASTLRSKYNNRDVDIKDYEFVYQMLLSQESQLTRGAELAGDTSYGIKGGQAYFRKTKGITDDAKLDQIWKQMQDADELGLHTGKDANGSYIDIELVNPIDDFTAMYTLTSNLYSPMPKEFIQELGGSDGYTAGAILYGTAPGKDDKFVDSTLCVGPYYLEDWVKNQLTVFARNDNWFEYSPSGNRYQIPGVSISIISQATQQDDAIYEHFENGELDSTGIPQSRMKEKLPTDRKTKGDSTFKLNVNSCTQDRWNDLFGDQGSVKTGKDNDYLVKPWMSNKNFLNGLFWSINRTAFAEARGVSPSINYFSDAYLSDPQAGDSYNETSIHANAIRNFHETNPQTGVDNFGYDFSKATRYFALAVQELADSGQLVLGTKSNPTKISIHIRWMYQTDIRDYGSEIGKYFTDAFNDSSVCDGKVVLEVQQEAVTQWDQVYNDYLMTGKFDLGFGAISGNTYNPLNFLEVLKSDNSSGFTLNWGSDTSEVNMLNPIVYEGKGWSFDALWTAADHGAVIQAGKAVNPVTKCYVANASTNNLFDGGTFEIPFQFVDVAQGVELKLDRIKIYLVMAESITIVPTNLATWQEDGCLKFSIDAALGKELNDLLIEGNKLDEKAEKAKTEDERWDLLHPFRRDTYNSWWNIEIYYTLRIAGGFATESVVYAANTEGEFKHFSIVQK